jgi:hypothetical protein
MSYESVWGIPFKELRSTGFRPLNDQAWAGVKTEAELEGVFERAGKLGLTTIVTISRRDLRVRYQYSTDMARLAGRDLGFRWSYIPFADLTKEERAGRNWDAVDPDRRAGFGMFANETDAVAWKLIAT